MSSIDLLDECDEAHAECLKLDTGGIVGEILQMTCDDYRSVCYREQSAIIYQDVLTQAMVSHLFSFKLEN